MRSLRSAYSVAMEFFQTDLVKNEHARGDESGQYCNTVISRSPLGCAPAVLVMAVRLVSKASSVPRVTTDLFCQFK